MADEEFMFGDLFATVRVQDLPASREVVAVERQENGTWRVCGSAIANTDGIAELGIEGSKTSRVYAFAIDHWGEPFTPNRTVAYGDIIRPSVFLGWLYRVTAPGALPGEEPVWWNSTPGMPRPVGSAMAQAEMYFQPIAHGPVDIEWEEVVGDPHWDKVVALLYFDGNLTDATGRIWTANGGAAVSSSIHKFGSGSLHLDGNNSYLSTPNVPDLRLGSSDFTVELFARIDAVGGQKGIFGNYAFTPGRRSFELYLDDSVLRLRLGQPNGQSPQIAPVSYTIGTTADFVHIAVTRDGDTFRLFVDGELKSEGTSSIHIYENEIDDFYIGATGPDISRFFNGYIDSVRFTNGVARYTEDFTPPSEPFPNFK